MDITPLVFVWWGETSRYSQQERTGQKAVYKGFDIKHNILPDMAFPIWKFPPSTWHIMTQDSSKEPQNSQTLEAGLYIVATPIGNLADITLRAIDVLMKVDVIACEDTRVTGKLLAHYGIHTRMLAYHEHNAGQVRPRLLEELAGGKRVALVSDAGTPLISDPGYKLVREATSLGIKVMPVPGASSVTAALSASGLPTNRILFAGFLPAKASARRKAIGELAAVHATLVLFESARRLAETLAELAQCMGGRQAVIAREITKLYEEFRRGTLEELAHAYADAEPKGEIVIIVAPPEEEEASYTDEVEAALAAALQEMSVKDAAAKIAQETGLPRQELYTRALALKDPR